MPYPDDPSLSPTKFEQNPTTFNFRPPLRGCLAISIFHSSGFHHICNIKCRLDCRYSLQNIFNAKNFNPHKKPISLLNVLICTQGIKQTWWPEAGTIIVTGPYCLCNLTVEKWWKMWIYIVFSEKSCETRVNLILCRQKSVWNNVISRSTFQLKDNLSGYADFHYKDKTVMRLS